MGAARYIIALLFNVLCFVRYQYDIFANNFNISVFTHFYSITIRFKEFTFNQQLKLIEKNGKWHVCLVSTPKKICEWLWIVCVSQMMLFQFNTKM